MSVLLSRVADSLYWISRYLERAENTARVVRVRLDLELDRRPDADAWDFAWLYDSLALPRPDLLPATPADLVNAVLLDLSNPSSAAACVTAARENARQAREEISSEMWEQLNGLFLRLQQVRTENVWASRPHYLCRMVIDGVHLFQGVTDATMGHGEGWQYLQAGRFLERAASTAALLALHFRAGPLGDPDARARIDPAECVGLLRSCSALEAYCRHYTADVRPDRVAEFLLLNGDFPRSIRFAAARVEASLRAIAQLTSRGAGGRVERLGGRLHALLDYGQVDEILNDDPCEYAGAIGRHCGEIHSALYQSYVAYPIESALPS